MANITFRVDDLLLAKARRLAAQRKLSLNAVVRKKLEEFVSADSDREAALRGIEAFFQRTHARVGKQRWLREEIHDR